MCFFFPNRDGGFERRMREGLEVLLTGRKLMACVSFESRWFEMVPVGFQSGAADGL